MPNFELFIGPPGAGKSTTGGLLGKNHGYIYYEADCFFLFVNPFINPNVEEASLALSIQKPLNNLNRKSATRMYSCKFFNNSDYEKLVKRHEYEQIENMLCDDHK